MASTETFPGSGQPVIPGEGAASAAGKTNYLNATSGIMSWLFTLDHKRIGIMYLVMITASFLLGGVFALLLRTEHFTPDQTIMGADLYNQLFTLHGAVMVFLVIIPGIPAGLGNIILPIMLGAKDVAFPRLNLTSLWLYMIGALLFVTVLLTGGLDTGWTFYTPYATGFSQTAVIAATSGAFILGFSSIFTGLNFIVTIHKLRPPGMTWFRMPLFLWSLYATAIIQILATPVLGITLLLLIVERTMQIGIFNPSLGGDPVLYQHFFWFYSHPAVYIMILPAMGVTSEMISVHSHKHIFGYKFIAFSSVAIALFGFLVWGHHMFVSGQSSLASTIFSFLTFSVAIPSAIKVFNWLTTVYRGNVELNTPMLYTLGFIFIFAIGGLTGMFLGTMAVDVHMHDTYFVVAHFHMVMASTMVAMFGALYHWWPKITGKMYNEFFGKLGAWIVVIGFVATFMPQFVMGSHGMPRRYWEYVPVFTDYHVASTIGSYILGLGFALGVINLVNSLFSGKPAPANPWGGASLEWRCPSPPPTENFHETPTVGDPYDFRKVVWNEQSQSYVHTGDVAAPESFAKAVADGVAGKAEADTKSDDKTQQE